MPAFETTLQRTAATGNSVGSILAQTTGLRRFRVYSMTFSSEATPAEVAILWQATRITAGPGTATAVTPAPKDTADSACSALAQQAHTSTEPTYATNFMYSNAVHQRATVRWIARDDLDMIVCPATNNLGLGWKTPTINGGTPVITLDVGFIE